MTFGDCEDCGTFAHLRFKPDVPNHEQTRPSVCTGCRMKREQQLVNSFQEETVLEADREADSYHQCDLCGCLHTDLGNALRCCGDRLEKTPENISK